MTIVAAITTVSREFRSDTRKKKSKAIPVTGRGGL
jgi:hypothetical protein